VKDETRLVHAGRDPFTHHGAVNVPVYHASTILSPDLDDFEKRDRRVTYGRTGTPTTFALEDIVSALEQADDTIICGSGLGAISTAMLALCCAGDHVLATDNVYSPVRNVLDKVLTRYGIEIGYYDPTDQAALKSAITPKTRLIWLESPGSQTFELTDIRAVAEIVRKHDILTAIDNTWSAGYFLKPLTMGVDVSVQAATKYLGGHSDIMLGTISCNEKTAEQVRSVFDYLGKGDLVGTNRLSDKPVARIVKAAATAIGADPAEFGGHSLRAGLATAAARAGAEERHIMRQTGHRSVQTVRRYIREGELFRDNVSSKVGL